MDTLQNIWQQYIYTPQTGALSAVLAVLSIIGMWLLFKKAKKAGWRSLVPILNVYTLCQIADSSGLKFLLFFIPVINVIYHFIFNFRLARSFGKGPLFGLGLVLFPPFFTLVLGLGGSHYRGPNGKKR